MNFGFVYKISRDQFDYVGSTCIAPERRFQFHVTNALKGSPSRFHTLLRADLEHGQAPHYGWQITQLERVEFRPDQDRAARLLFLRQREQHHMDEARQNFARSLLNQQNAYTAPEERQRRLQAWYNERSAHIRAGLKEKYNETVWRICVDKMHAAPQLDYRAWYEREYIFNLRPGMTREQVIEACNAALAEAPENKKRFILNKAVRLSTRDDLVRAPPMPAPEQAPAEEVAA